MIRSSRLAAAAALSFMSPLVEAKPKGSECFQMNGNITIYQPEPLNVVEQTSGKALGVLNASRVEIPDETVKLTPNLEDATALVVHDRDEDGVMDTLVVKYGHQHVDLSSVLGKGQTVQHVAQGQTPLEMQAACATFPCTLNLQVFEVCEDSSVTKTERAALDQVAVRPGSTH